MTLAATPLPAAPGRSGDPMILRLTTAALYIALSTPGSHGESGTDFAGLGRNVRVCIDRQAKIVSPKPVDLETASIAVVARCDPEVKAMRKFAYTSIPNFVPSPDWWSKEIEPAFLKRAREAVALARTQ